MSCKGAVAWTIRLDLMLCSRGAKTLTPTLFTFPWKRKQHVIGCPFAETHLADGFAVVIYLYDLRHNNIVSGVI